MSYSDIIQAKQTSQTFANFFVERKIRQWFKEETKETKMPEDTQKVANLESEM